MKTNPRIQVIEHKIKNLKVQLGALGPLRPGSLSRQYHVCRKPGCRCQHPRKPQRHGPYYHLDHDHHGKKPTHFIRAEQLPELPRQIAQFKKLPHWLEQRVTLSSDRTEILRKESAQPTFK